MNVLKKQLSFRRKFLRDENKRYTSEFTLIPKEDWPSDREPNRAHVYRSRHFLVQVFEEENSIIRLSVCRTELDSSGGYKDGIAWDELQEIKNKIGFSDRDAVEIYPSQSDLVNVANIRHLWILPTPIDFKWRKEPK